MHGNLKEFAHIGNWTTIPRSSSPQVSPCTGYTTQSAMLWSVNSTTVRHWRLASCNSQGNTEGICLARNYGYATDPCQENLFSAQKHIHNSKSETKIAFTFLMDVITYFPSRRKTISLCAVPCQHVIASSRQLLCRAMYVRLHVLTVALAWRLIKTFS